jgi:5-methyltetrahydropteroyltriglutamate--homocysteine methyltransferase
VTPFIGGLEGVALSDAKTIIPAWGEISVPVVKSPLRWTHSLFEEDLIAAREVTELPIKISFPGPYTLARLIEDPDNLYDSVGGFIEAWSDLIAEEMRILVSDGATIIQVQEPLILLRPADYPRLAASLDPLNEAKGTALLALMLSGPGIEPLYDWLQNLKVDILCLDFIHSPRLVDMINDRQTARTLGLGVVDPVASGDCRSDTFRQMLDHILAGVSSDHVHLHPCSDLSPLAPDAARDCLAGLVESARNFSHGS